MYHFSRRNSQRKLPGDLKNRTDLVWWIQVSYPNSLFFQPNLPIGSEPGCTSLSIKNMSELKLINLGMAHMPVIPLTWEAEAGGFLEPRS
jgi:hypothetical protein